MRGVCKSLSVCNSRQIHSMIYMLQNGNHVKL